MKSPKYKIREKVWLYPGMTGWHFVNVGQKLSDEIEMKFGKNSRGFGSLKVVITVGKTNWETSIFPDKKLGTYVLPLKADVRKKEGISVGKLLAYPIQLVV